MTAFTPNCTCFFDGHEVRGKLEAPTFAEDSTAAFNVTFLITDMVWYGEFPTTKSLVTIPGISTSLIQPDPELDEIRVGWGAGTQLLDPLHIESLRWLVDHLPVGFYMKIRLRTKFKLWERIEPYIKFRPVADFEWYDHPKSVFNRRAKGIGK